MLQSSMSTCDKFFIQGLIMLIQILNESLSSLVSIQSYKFQKLSLLLKLQVLQVKANV